MADATVDNGGVVRYRLGTVEHAIDTMEADLTDVARGLATVQMDLMALRTEIRMALGIVKWLAGIVAVVGAALIVAIVRVELGI